MTFYERYEALCRVRGIDPCSQSTAEKLGTTRSNVSYWKKGTKPNVEIVRNAANLLQTPAVCWTGTSIRNAVRGKAGSASGTK